VDVMAGQRATRVTPAVAPAPIGHDRLAHAPSDHPPVKRAKIGVLLANLGTPDNYDYWSMRRYLNEFLSDKRVVDYSPWLWQPLLQTVILTKRPFSSGANYKLIWNEELNESPLLTITRAQTARIAESFAALYGDSVMVNRPQSPRDGGGRMRKAVVFPALSALCGGYVSHCE